MIQLDKKNTSEVPQSSGKGFGTWQWSPTIQPYTTLQYDHKLNLTWNPNLHYIRTLQYTSLESYTIYNFDQILEYIFTLYYIRTLLNTT